MAVVALAAAAAAEPIPQQQQHQEMDDASLVQWMAHTMSDIDALRVFHEYQQTEDYAIRRRKRAKVAIE